MGKPRSLLCFNAVGKIKNMCIRETTWRAARSKGVRAALTASFGSGWSSVLKESSKQTRKYGGRKALSYITGVVCGYFGSAAVILVWKSAKIVKCAKVCHSVCSGGLDVEELCASAPSHIVEIVIFGRPIVIEGNGFYMFSKDTDPVEDIGNLLKK